MNLNISDIVNMKVEEINDISSEKLAELIIYSFYKTASSLNGFDAKLEGLGIYRVDNEEHYLDFPLEMVEGESFDEKVVIVNLPKERIEHRKKLIRAIKNKTDNLVSSGWEPNIQNVRMAIKQGTITPYQGNMIYEAIDYFFNN